MRHNSQLTNVLHVLLHMARKGEPMTSDEVALCLHTNPVVVRRTLAALREAGLVHSARGHGGGWVLGRTPAAVTLGQVYAALGEPAVFQLGPRDDNPQCLVEQSVNGALEGAFAEAKSLLLARMDAVTLADLAADVGKRFALFEGEHRHAI